MTQKVVIRVSLMDDDKSSKKAMKILATICGVDYICFKRDKSQMEVIGEFDAVKLIQLLRKRIGHAELLSIDAASGKKKEDNDDNGSGGGDDDNNGGAGGKNNKKGSDHDGNGDNYKSGYDGGAGETNGMNMDSLGKALFGYRYRYHAGNGNEYPVEQLQCAQEVRSSEPKCLFHHAIMIS